MDEMLFVLRTLFSEVLRGTLHVHHVSLFISLSLLLHDYNVKLDKLPN